MNNKIDKVKKYQHKVAMIILNKSWKKKVDKKNKNSSSPHYLSPLRFELFLEDEDEDYMKVSYMELDEIIYYMDLD